MTFGTRECKWPALTVAALRRLLGGSSLLGSTTKCVTFNLCDFLLSLSWGNLGVGAPPQTTGQCVCNRLSAAAQRHSEGLQKCYKLFNYLILNILLQIHTSTHTNHTCMTCAHHVIGKRFRLPLNECSAGVPVSHVKHTPALSSCYSCSTSNHNLPQSL